MSLVHEGLVGLINRRFVATYFNTYPGPGYDKDGVEMLRGIPNPRYGLIATPNGKKIRSFGYDFREVYSAFVKSLAENPKQNWKTPEEKELLHEAQMNPSNVHSQLKAARVELGLLEIDKVIARMKKLANTCKAVSDQSVASWFAAHAELQRSEPDVETLKASLLSIKGLPPALEFERQVDLMSLNLRLKKGTGFFHGWELRPGTDLEQFRSGVAELLKKLPESSRCGELRFYLGLAQKSLGEHELADLTWKKHFREMPEDRFAMLSRIHHSGYKFSPYKDNVMKIRTTSKVLRGEKRWSVSF